jgi:cell division protein FtsL
MRQEAAALEFENAQLTEKTENISTVQGVEQIAQEDLEMVSPDTILIDPD